MGRLAVLAALALVCVAACGGGGRSADGTTTSATVTSPSTAGAGSDPTSTTTTVPSAATSTTVPGSRTTPRPGWLGTRVLPERSDGLGEIRPTPPELVDRRFATVNVLAPPTTDEFSADVGPVPDEVAARSTWGPGCPVPLDDLRYVTLPFRGFDGALHTGELLVNAEAVDAVVAGFAHLFSIDFPIEEMRITRPDELDAPPTGDGNDTGAFVCRPSVGSTSWSRHAYGLAVDVNPFQNPYVRGDVVVPELASAYVDRSYERPGMLRREHLVGFLDAGWGWGGEWGSSKDWMHVSADGR